MISENIVNRYPIHLNLGDGTAIEIRPLKKDDKELLWNFFQEIPDNDRLFLKDNVIEKTVVESWCNGINYEMIFPLLALHDGKIIGDATLHLSQRTWMHHIANLRIVIHPKFRHRGLATQMLQELITLTKQTDLEMLDAEFMSEQESAILAFERVGFNEIARIEQHVIDIEGKPHDFVILSYELKKNPAGAAV